MTIKKQFDQNGFYIHKLSNKKPVLDIQNVLLLSNHNKIKDQKLFDLKSLSLQHKIYNQNTHIKILNFEKKFFLKVLGIKSFKDLCVTSFFHLRAVNKISKNKNKNFLGFHRETFYSDHSYTKHQINVSVPILNYNKMNSMKLVTSSHKIPDSKIKTIRLDSSISGVEKGSAKHKLGIPYNPKKIISGVNLSKAKRVDVKVGNLLIFSAMLIHGNGSNNLNKIRYSIDFGLIKKKFIKNKKIKEHHISYSKSKKYWINLGL
jgi:hypothetical protein